MADRFLAEGRVYSFGKRSERSGVALSEYNRRPKGWKNNLLCAEIDGNIPHNRESESTKPGWKGR